MGSKSDPFDELLGLPVKSVLPYWLDRVCGCSMEDETSRLSRYGSLNSNSRVPFRLLANLCPSTGRCHSDTFYSQVQSPERKS